MTVGLSNFGNGREDYNFESLITESSGRLTLANAATTLPYHYSQVVYSNEFRREL